MTEDFISKKKPYLMVHPSRFDYRDHIYFHYLKESTTTVLAEKVDLREYDSPVESQDFLGSCVGNAIANAYEHMVKFKYPNQFVDLSRLFVYYNARRVLNEELLDIGTTVRLGLQTVKQYGIPRESLWPYNVEQFDDRPSDQAYADAAQRKITEYQRLYSKQSILTALSNNSPVVFGINVYDKFMYMDKSNPIVSMPESNNILVGGHAMCLVGYNNKKQLLIAKNSFGTNWGDNGYCYIPYKYFGTYSYDRWIFDIPPQPAIA